MTSSSVKTLTTAETAFYKEALIELLIDAVNDGAGVSFIQPMTRDKAEAFWDKAFASHARHERVILVIEKEGRLEGSVQLVLTSEENQAFRADVAKMLVHSRARNQGLGAKLLEAVEAEALKIGRTLIVLDTVTDSAGERLYRRAGWTALGVVPGYATNANGVARDAATFFYKDLSA